MANSQQSPLADKSQWTKCFYVNATSIIQIVRVTNIANWHFERAAFPGKPLLFQAPQEANLEIYSSEMATGVLAERIPCSLLRYYSHTDLPQSVQSNELILMN